MRVFTYGMKKEEMDAIKHRFGTADYFDVTSRYQDILALCVDIVVIAVDHMPKDILNTIKAYQAEVSEDEDAKYYYLTDAQIDEWSRGVI